MRRVRNQILNQLWPRGDTSDITHMYLSSQRRASWIKLLSWTFLPRLTEKCNSTLEKHMLFPQDFPLPWALGVSLSRSPSLSLVVCLAPFPSLAWHIDPLNAFRTSHLTSCMCCFSSSERPLGVQKGNLAHRFFFFLFLFSKKGVGFFYVVCYFAFVCLARRTIPHWCRDSSCKLCFCREYYNN